MILATVPYRDTVGNGCFCFRNLFLHYEELSLLPDSGQGLAELDPTQPVSQQVKYFCYYYIYYCDVLSLLEKGLAFTSCYCGCGCISGVMLRILILINTQLLRSRSGSVIGSGSGSGSESRILIFLLCPNKENRHCTFFLPNFRRKTVPVHFYNLS